MLFGQFLFTLAAFSIAGAVAFGLVFGIARLIVYKISGRDLSPQPEPGSVAWAEEDKTTTVDMAQKSLLTEQPGRTQREPVVTLAGEAYRVTKLGRNRWLVTELRIGRRLGMFELDDSGRRQEVIPLADDPANAGLIVRVAVLASLVRRKAA